MGRMTLNIYERDAAEFTTLGLGALPDVLSGTVEERRNESINLEFTYPAGGKNVDLIQPGRIVTCRANDSDNPQPFRITDVQRPTTDALVISGQHLALWTLSSRVITPVQTAAGTGANVIRSIQGAAYGALGVELSSDITTTGSYKTSLPKGALEAIVGTEGSFVDVFGGIIHADGLTVKVEAHRGQDRDVTAAYGVNLISLDQEQNQARYATHVFPVWHDVEGGNPVYAPGQELDLGAPAGSVKRTVLVDLSDEFQNAPTPTQLRDAALRYAADNLIQTPEVTISASFLPLWYSAEYRDKVEARQIQIGDTITITHRPLGIVGEKHRVVATTWDICRERYTEIQLGAITRRLTEMI